MSLAADRIARGQCPQCGNEAAPYYLCFSCRQKNRFTRCLKRGARLGALTTEIRGKDIYYGLPKDRDRTSGEARHKEWGKWQTPIIPGDTDGRYKPRLRGVRVDVEATLVEVIRHIGRPCTIEEITAVWGKLRAQRSSPLSLDLARLIKAEDKRKQKLAKQARIASRNTAEQESSRG